MNSELIVLLSTVSMALIGLLSLIVRYFYTSKCAKFYCCCCGWERDIQSEIHNDDHISPPSNDKV
jgi:hypothetical protein